VVEKSKTGEASRPTAAGPDWIVRTGRSESTVQVVDAAAPTLPALSMARTENVCSPWLRPVTVFGLVQAAKAPPSRAHSNETSASLSEKLNVALVLATSPCVLLGSMSGAGGASPSCV
jgi:hypothetical protein